MSVIYQVLATISTWKIVEMSFLDDLQHASENTLFDQSVHDYFKTLYAQATRLSGSTF